MVHALFRTGSHITLRRSAVILCAGGRSGAWALMSRLMSSIGKTCEWLDVTSNGLAGWCARVDAMCADGIAVRWRAA